MRQGGGHGGRHRRVILPTFQGVEPYDATAPFAQPREGVGQGGGRVGVVAVRKDHNDRARIDAMPRRAVGELCKRCTDFRAAAKAIGQERQAVERAQRIRVTQRVRNAHKAGVEQPRVGGVIGANEAGEKGEKHPRVDCHRAGDIAKGDDPHLPVWAFLARECQRLAPGREAGTDQAAKVDLIAPARGAAAARPAVGEGVREVAGDGFSGGNVLRADQFAHVVMHEAGGAAGDERAGALAMRGTCTIVGGVNLPARGGVFAACFAAAAAVGVAATL